MATLRTHATILIGLVCVLWAIELIDLLLFRRGLDGLGIRPRTVGGLVGVFFAPFLHGGLAHLAANTVPLLVLGWLVIARRTSDFFVVSIVVVVLGGLGVWLVGGANTVHIGASGLIFGLLGYLLARAYFERSFVSMLIAVPVGLAYGGTLWGVLPTRPGVSWEGHLFGFVAGVVAAWMLAERR
jgi:membrane associated rhomboid family serine protease